MRRSPLRTLALALAMLVAGHAPVARAALLRVAAEPNVSWVVADSVSACPAGDSVAAGHPARVRIVVTYLQAPGGTLTPRVGAPAESIWVEWDTAAGDVRVNDQPGRAFADDSTDAQGRARITLPSLSGCGTLALTVRVAGTNEGSALVSVRGVDADLDGAVTAADTPCDLDYDGTSGAADLALAAAHAHHSHRNAVFGTLVRRTNLCETCAEYAPNTLGESSLSWSPDGRSLACTIHMPPIGDCSVFIVPSDPADGDTPVQFTFPGLGVHDYDPTWSPLGTEIAFGRDDHTIWVKGVPGLAADTSLRLVTTHDDGSAKHRGDLTPAFSPDGEWIAFSRKEAPATHWHLWKTPANGDTTRRVQVTADASGDDMYPQWSSDGAWLVYDRTAGGLHSAWRVPAAGGTPEPVLSASGPVMASTPAFAPDGAVMLAGVGDTLGAEARTLDATLTALSATSPFAVAVAPGFGADGHDPVLSPRVSPDGTRLAVRTEQLWAARRNMSLPPVITRVAGLAIPPATPVVSLGARVGIPMQCSIDAADPEGDPLTLHAYFLHDGMAFDPGTRTFTWTPPALSAGTRTLVRFQASTPSGGSAYALAAIAVASAAGVTDAAATHFALAPPRPNPTSAGATLRLTTPAAAWVRAEIFDATGRRVRSLASAMLEAGVHELAWDARDAAGMRAAPGLYVCRVRAGGESVEQKLVVVAP